MRQRNILLLFVLIIVVAPMSGCFIYHEPAFKGTILDINTKQPIEGAVVVVEYRKEFMGVGAGSISSTINVRETLTDKEGNFRIPSYTTLIAPLSLQDKSIFIIFKPGYASLELALKEYFTGEETREQEGPWRGNPELKFKLRGPGIVELPKVRTQEERKQAWRGVHIFDPYFIPKESDLPILHKIIQEERRNIR
jgi:hypothetical protein